MIEVIMLFTEGLSSNYMLHTLKWYTCREGAGPNGLFWFSIWFK